MFTSNVVLSPCHNPPYRPPMTARNGSHSPPATDRRNLTSPPAQTQPPNDPSPKRKRGNSSNSASPTWPSQSSIQSQERPQSDSTARAPSQPNTDISTTTNDHKAPFSPSSSATVISSGADSPRSKVAARFQDLDLQPASSSGSDVCTNLVERLEGSGGSRKRAKWSEVERSTTDLSPPFSPSSSPASAGRGRVVEETPGRDPRQAIGNSNAVIARSGEASTKTTMTVIATGRTRSVPETPRCRQHEEACSGSPSLSPPASPTPQQEQEQKQQQQRRRAGEQDKSITNPLQARLTWQPSEITGHEIDFASGEDDGEGINGIGFKPTPALAWARQQRRRQQVNEWRAREAREARLRRMERRRAGEGPGPGSGERSAVDAAENGGTRMRMVRFAEVG